MVLTRNYNYLIDLIGGYWIDERGYHHLKVEGKPYDIKFHPMTLEWYCDCPAFRFQKGNCKHIKQIQK